MRSGAIGALGIVLAFTFGGAPLYVMPLVFGGAPVINAFLTIYWAGRMKEIGPLFLGRADHGDHRRGDGARDGAACAGCIGGGDGGRDGGRWLAGSRGLLAIALAVVSWGAYGPVLHKGQAAMHHSRLRPLICVGLAYFVIAVIVPYFFLGEMGENSSYLRAGHDLGLLGGACGAVGALGIILAFNFGGKPVYRDAARVRRGAGDHDDVVGALWRRGSWRG